MIIVELLNDYRLFTFHTITAPFAVKHTSASEEQGAGCREGAGVSSSLRSPCHPAPGQWGRVSHGRSSRGGSALERSVPGTHMPLLAGSSDGRAHGSCGFCQASCFGVRYMVSSVMGAASSSGSTTTTRTGDLEAKSLTHLRAHLPFSPPTAGSTLQRQAWPHADWETGSFDVIKSNGHKPPCSRHLPVLPLL